MTKFKAGDKVRVITDRHGKSQKGLVGVVQRPYTHSSDYDVWVKFERQQMTGCLQIAHENCYADTALELVTDKQVTAWMVALVEDGVFKPSAAPKRHATQAEAVTEATRLASVHGGEYHVLKSVAAAARPVQPVTVTTFS